MKYLVYSIMRSRGKIVSRDKLMQKLWETDSFVDENTLSVNVARLRKKLESIGMREPNPSRLTTILLGYFCPLLLDRRQPACVARNKTISKISRRRG